MKPFTVLVLPAVVFAGNTADAADWWALRPVVEPPVPALGGPGAD
jgi:hypothetical protein